MIEYFARHPTAANLLMLLFVAIGLTSLPSLKRETFPDFQALEVEVRIPYPGASALDVEEAVCHRIEDALDGINDLYEARCESREGLAVAVAEMREEGELSRFLDDVKTEVDAIDNFPEQVETPVVQQRNRTDQVVSVALSGPMSATQLKAYAEDFKDRLQQLPQVSLVTLVGFSQRQFQVAVYAQSLSQHGMSISQLVDAIARQNIDLPAGSIETRDRNVLIRFVEQRRSRAELSDLVVLGDASGGEVRLGDIAAISDGFEVDEDKVLLNGRRAALLQVTKTKSEDTLNVVQAVKGFVAGERERAPPGLELHLTQDLASIVEDRLHMLLSNGAQGLVLVFLVMWLFFHLRFAFWVALGLPVSFLGGLFFMSVLGYSINMLTMVALLIALGLLMDDAIVISENIASHLRRGKSALTAAVDGSRQVAQGVLSSFLTTVAVFGPLSFLSGDIGKVLKVLPVALILVLAVSLVEAFLILPHHLEHALAKGGGLPRGRFRAGFEDGLDSFRERILGRGVDWAVRQRYLFLGLVFGLFLVSASLLAGGVLKFQAFPDIEGDTLEARILLPQGTPLSRTEAVVERATRALERVDAASRPLQPGGESLVRGISTRYNHNPDAFESGPHLATVTVDLMTAERRRVHLDDLVLRWREEVGRLPDVIGLTFKEPAIGPAGLAIEIRLSGSDLDVLKAASRELQEWLGRYKGTFDIMDDLRPGKHELRVRLEDGALGLGLDAATVASQLRAAFFGATASEIQVGGESYEIDVRLRVEDRADLSSLEDFRVITNEGGLVPLSVVADWEWGRGYGRINRVDGRRTVTIRGEVDTRQANADEIIRDTRSRFLPDLLERNPGLSASVQGQSRESATTAASMRRGFLLGLVGIFVLLSFQFRSYREPLAVMIAIPLAAIGVIWGHLLMGLDLSMPSVMGFVSLAGIVVNDSILLVEFLKLGMREGLSAGAAARRASRQRFRAVLLTSLTTIAGLLPLLAERSLQAQILIPLAVSIVFGLLASTLLVLLVLPALYSVFSDLGWVRVTSENGIAPGRGAGQPEPSG